MRRPRYKENDLKFAILLSICFTVSLLLISAYSEFLQTQTAKANAIAAEIKQITDFIVEDAKTTNTHRKED